MLSVTDAWRRALPVILFMWCFQRQLFQWSKDIRAVNDDARFHLQS